MRRVSPEPNSGCWLWLGVLTKSGYGRVYSGGSLKMAHRVSFEMHVGEIPAGLDLDHLCRVRCCVNPEHLEPVTRKENIRRGVGVGKANKAKLCCPRGHLYDSANTEIESHGWRRCRACIRERRLERLGRVQI